MGCATLRHANRASCLSNPQIPNKSVHLNLRQSVSSPDLSTFCAGHCGWYSSWHLGLPKAQAKDECSHYGFEPCPRGSADSKGEGDHA